MMNRKSFAKGALRSAVGVGMSLLLLAGCGAKGTEGGEAKVSTEVTGDSQAQASDVTQGAGAASQQQTPQQQTQRTGDQNTLTVVACPGVHVDILNMAKVILASEGITLEVDSDFDDYMMPNLLVDGGVYDCNYFQHEEYLKSFNEEQGTDLVSVGKIHFEPLGIYPGRKKSLKSIESGDIITIPRDSSNQARALQLLADAGLITLNPSKQYESSINDVQDNPKGIKIELMDASQIAAAVAQSAFVVMNGNYARQALYTVTSDAIAYENAESAVASKYANIIAVNRGNENDPRVLSLVKALQSDGIKTYIRSRFAGAVVPYSGQ